MQSRQEPASQFKNRATGFSDADWGALEKRLSDTRDLLRDILSHLRTVLDNLKSAGTKYQSAGRAWRKTDSPADGMRRQHGHRQNGPAAGAQKPQGPAGSRFQSSTSQSTTSSRFTDSSARQSTFGKAPFGKTAESGQAKAGSTFKSKTDSQAGTGFSWSFRAKTEYASSASSARTSTGSGSAGQQKASPGAGQARSEATGSSSQQRAYQHAGQHTGKQAGQQTGQQTGQQAGHKAGQKQEHRHRTTGPGGGSSYQEYKQRSHKSPLGQGRMTLTQACALLCITYPCNADDIRVAYRKQARRHHPDLGGDEEMMKSINQAYELAISWCSPLRGKTATWAA
ncbi:MAG: J domain-containing protein [Desulfovibrio sp.]|nr:J domain-containing protein [Desulfovibrio sp.]MBI4959841.1 J domain-containing protein [Desulfovibrio sp.]